MTQLRAQRRSVLASLVVVPPVEGRLCRSLFISRDIK